MPIHLLGYLAALTGLTAIGLAVYRHKIHYHFRTVEEGKLYRSGALGPAGLHSIYRKVPLKTIVNLNSEKECSAGSWFEKEKEFCREKGITLINIFMRPSKIPSQEEIRRFLEITLNPEYHPVLVHCKQGVMRTGMMVAMYLKNRFDTPNEEILKNLPLFDHDLEKTRNAKIRTFILTYQPESSASSINHSINT
ncbi:MAG: tyrosine-protein phosphatase [Sedimentisphaerales bacterium]|nr:tyrosine-protein phosphatase [Sedimentisphaerales bacterium]